MVMRAETVFILSSLDKSTLAEFPEELDPCIDEALRDPEVINRISTITGPITAAKDLRILPVQTREQVAEQIQAVTVPAAVVSSDPTPIPGIVTPKPETGLPPVPVPVPGIEIPEVKVPGAHTIEFQELIPGLKPPAIPMLIPGLEKLPLLPGWTVRDKAGEVVSEGMRIPTLKGLPGIPIPEPLPEPYLPIGGYVPSPVVTPVSPGQHFVSEEYTEADILEQTILEETEGAVEPLLGPRVLSDESLELDMMGLDNAEEVLVPNGVLEDEELEL